VGAAVADGVFISASAWYVKLVDFGLAKNLAPATEADQTFHDLTHSGMTVGTVAYMSTEQVRGETLDGRTDLFSAMVFDAILHRRIEHPSALNPSVPPSLDRVVARAVEKDRKRRYLSAADLYTALQKVHQELQTSGAASAGVVASEPTTRRNPPRPKKTDSGKSRAFESLAVLPFVNVTADADSEYLSDGITESIINKLSQVGGLRVVPRSTVFGTRAATT
jgi:serine/threonine-protein kinase